jgi:hypothetical protein
MRTLLLTGLGVLAVGVAALVAADSAAATPLVTGGSAVVADGAGFGYRCAPRRRVVVRRTYVRPTYTRTCAPRYSVARTYYRPYAVRPYYYAPAVSIGVGFGYGQRYYAHRGHGHYGQRYASHRGHGHRSHGHRTYRSVGRRR